MALTRRKYSYVDFTQEPYRPQFAKTTHAVATAADNQEDYMWIGNNYFEWIQTGQNDALMWDPQTTAPFGWLAPCDNADADGIEMTQGMAASSSAGAMSFTVGTDAAFFLRVKMVVTTLANIDVCFIGFRELGAYTDITTPALAASVYNEKAVIGVNTNAGAVVAINSKAGSDTTTTATNTPIVTATAFTWQVDIDASGNATYKVDGTADTLANAAAHSITSATVLVPCFYMVATGAGASNVRLQEWECGYSELS